VYYVALFEALSWFGPRVKAWLLSSIPNAPGLYKWLISSLSIVGAFLVVTLSNISGLVVDMGMREALAEDAAVLILILVVSAWLQLEWVINWARWLFPHLVLAAPEHDDVPGLVDEETGKPLVGLSIDDVPSTFEKFGPSKIEACLQLLEEHGARATLFVMSQELAKHDAHAHVSDALVGAVSRGHELGNHDVLDVKTVLRSSKDLAAALRECDETISGLMQRAHRPWQGWDQFEAGLEAQSDKAEDDATTTNTIVFDDGAGSRDPMEQALRGEPIKWFRPGGGFFGPQMIRIAARHGYATALGNCFSFDTHMPVAHNVWHLRWRCGPGKIIVLHDRPKLLSTLHKVLPDLCSRYKLVPLSELFRAAAQAKTACKGGI